MTTLNRREFAELLGVTGPMVRHWIKAGMPATRPGAAGNAPVEIDSIAALRWLIRQHVKRAMRHERRLIPCHDLPELSTEELARL